MKHIQTVAWKCGFSSTRHSSSRWRKGRKVNVTMWTTLKAQFHLQNVNTFVNC